VEESMRTTVLVAALSLFAVRAIAGVVADKD
jgi:hypothetical protein